MPKSGETGELLETRFGICVEWKISDFFSPSEEAWTFLESPTFPLTDSRWCLRITQNCECDKHLGWVGLYLIRRDWGISKTVNSQLSVKKVDCTTVKICDFKYNFDGTPNFFEYGSSKAFKRSELLRRKSELVPSNVLTIIAVLKSEAPHSMEFSSFKRSQNVIRSLKCILAEGTHSDVVLKTEETEVEAHRLILQTRSPVFAKMFCHEMLEKQTGVVRISDVESDVLECVLSYMYTGEAEGMLLQNVCKVYMAADKYDLPELKMLCTMFMEENLSVEVICDVIKIVDMYDEPKLKERSIEYFAQNIGMIFKSHQWKKFRREKNELAFDFLQGVAVERIPKT